MTPTSQTEMPVARSVAAFDTRSGNLLERLVFNHRTVFLALCVAITVVLGFLATRSVVNASFDRMIPQNHPYIKNYFENREKFRGAGNVVRIVIETRKGDIFDPAFLETTRKINDALFLMPGVDRAWMKSIWMSSVRWTEVTDEGFRGGPVMSDASLSPAGIEALKRNVRAAGVVGSLIGSDYKSIMIVVPLLEKNPNSPLRLDYGQLSQRLEQLRQTYQSADGIDGGVDIKIVGFAKLVGDLIEGLKQVMAYFALAALVAALAIYLYSRCIRSTLLVLGCSFIAVVWLLGCTRLLGFEIDPYSVLVPFLVFAIGVSHGAQKMNGIMQDVGRGTHKYVAARYTFRRLFVAGITALLADVVGFAVLILIDIPVIKDLAISASIGVGILIFTNLLLFPVMLSYVGVSPAAAHRSLVGEGGDSSARGLAWGMLERFTTPCWAWGTIGLYAILTVVGYAFSLDMKIGDLDPGAPELRLESRYNRDSLYINHNYKVSSDQFVVIVKTPENQCADFRVLKRIEDLTYELRQLPGVIDTFAFSDSIKGVVAGFQEGNPKWYTIPRNNGMLGSAAQWVSSDNPDVVDTACSVVPVVAYLSDHKAEMLERVVKRVEQFASENDSKEARFLLAAGPAGIDAVTNAVVAKSSRTMLYWVYGAVALLCMITFRSWRATVVALVPLIITSILCEALMALLGIGVKVATLPVIAVGVGIGVDYALYLLSVQLFHQRAGVPLGEAYRRAVAFTGKVVALVGITLAGGVITWIWSPIKFQADMGILLTFMFLWNMIGALTLIPALSHVLLQPRHRNQAAAAKASVEMARRTTSTHG